MSHGRHIYSKSSDMSRVTMCVYTHSDHALPHWKCVLQCCAKCPCVNISYQETGDQYSDTHPSNTFHIYHLILCCTSLGRLTLNDKKDVCMCKQDSDSEQSTKIYTRKDLVMTEITISNFHTSFYISSIGKVGFHLPRVRIIGANNCGDSRQTAFKRRKLFQDVLCRRDYADMEVARFSNQIQSEYSGGNISVSIEGILLGHFSALL